MKRGIYCQVPVVDSEGNEVGHQFRPAETSAEIEAIERELAATGALMTRKVHLTEDGRVTYLDSFIVSIVDEEDGTDPMIQVGELS